MREQHTWEQSFPVLLERQLGYPNSEALVRFDQARGIREFIMGRLDFREASRGPNYRRVRVFRLPRTGGEPKACDQIRGGQRPKSLLVLTSL